MGNGELDRRLPDGASADDLWRALVAERPELEALRPSTRTIVNGRVVDGAQRLADGDDVALLPPFGGG